MGSHYLIQLVLPNMFHYKRDLVITVQISFPLFSFYANCIEKFNYMLRTMECLSASTSLQTIHNNVFVCIVITPLYHIEGYFCEV